MRSQVETSGSLDAYTITGEVPSRSARRCSVIRALAFRRTAGGRAARRSLSITRSRDFSGAGGTGGGGEGRITQSVCRWRLGDDDSSELNPGGYRSVRKVSRAHPSQGILFLGHPATWKVRVMVCMQAEVASILQAPGGKARQPYQWADRLSMAGWVFQRSKRRINGWRDESK